MLLGLYRTCEYAITLWLCRIGAARTQATYKPGVYQCCHECTRAAGDVPDGNNTLWCFGKFLEPNATARLQAFSCKRNMCMCLSLHRGSRKASDRRGLVYDRMEAGFHWLHTSLREAKTDSKLLQTGPRELQQGFISAQKSCTPTQVQCTVASYQFTANGPRRPTTSSQWSLYQPRHLRSQHAPC